MLINMSYIKEPKNVDLEVGPSQLGKDDIALITKAVKAYSKTGNKPKVLDQKIASPVKLP